MKSIILYYSRSGKTQKLVDQLQGELHCETIKVEPKETYKTFVGSVARVVKEVTNEKNVEFVNEIPDLSAYNTIFVGYPIWANDIPSFFKNFLTQCDLEEKTVVPFCTFAINDITKSLETLHTLFPNTKIELPFNYGLKKKDSFENWVKEIHYLDLKKKERKII